MTESDLLTVEFVSTQLANIVSSEYIWPTPPPNYALEFIHHPDGDIILDFLNRDTAVFLSEDSNTSFTTPCKNDGTPNNVQNLINTGRSR